MSLREQMKEDLAAIVFNPDDFAEECSYTPYGTATARALNIIFEPDYKQVAAFQTSVAPGTTVCLALTTDLTNGGKIDDTLLIRSVVYYVAQIKPQRAGYTILVLSKHPTY